MVLATLLLICSIPQMDDTAKVVNDLPAVSSDSATKDSTLVAAALPSAPAPKVKADAEPIGLSPAAQPLQPIKPVFTAAARDVHGKGRSGMDWLSLGAAERRLTPGPRTGRLPAGTGTEANPFLASVRAVRMQFMPRRR